MSKRTPFLHQSPDRRDIQDTPGPINSTRQFHRGRPRHGGENPLYNTCFLNHCMHVPAPFHTIPMAIKYNAEWCLMPVIIMRGGAVTILCSHDSKTLTHPPTANSTKVNKRLRGESKSNRGQGCRKYIRVLALRNYQLKIDVLRTK